MSSNQNIFIIPDASTLLSRLNSKEKIASVWEENFATMTDVFKSQIRIVASEPPEARNRPHVENFITFIDPFKLKL